MSSGPAAATKLMVQSTRHLRALARAPAHITHESNAAAKAWATIPNGGLSHALWQHFAQVLHIF